MRRATILSEAGRVAYTLERLLDRAEVPIEGARELARAITVAEQAQLLKAHGRIESRSRFKAITSGHPLLDRRKVNHLFLDESGKSGKSVEPLFTLAAVAMSEEALKEYQGRADAVKQAYFGTTQVTFHEPHMRRHETIFHFHGDEAVQGQFRRDVDRLVAEADFVAFGVAVRKDVLSVVRGDTEDHYLPWDTYSVAIHLLLERYIDYLSSALPTSLGRVTFESQGSKEDAQHLLAYTELLLSGTQWVPDTAFRNWLETSAYFEPKSGSHGTELADMVSRDLWEWVRSGCSEDPPRWETFTAKAYSRDDQRMGKYGFKVFPDTDIRELIEAHRLRTIS